MNYNFIRTTDWETANTLRKIGYTEIQSSELGVYIFINRNEMQFSSDIDKSKIQYSNILCV